MNILDKQTVPFFVPFFDEDEAQEVVKTIKSNWLTSRPKCADALRESDRLGL